MDDGRIRRRRSPWATTDAVLRIADQLETTPAHVALSWLADRPGGTAPNVGARTAKQIVDNLAAVDLTLPEAARAELDAVSAPRAGRYPYSTFGRSQRARSYVEGKPFPAPPYTVVCATATGKIER